MEIHMPVIYNMGKYPNLTRLLEGMWKLNVCKGILFTCGVVSRLLVHGCRSQTRANDQLLGHNNAIIGICELPEGVLHYRKIYT
jgi:hypothetical protein